MSEGTNYGLNENYRYYEIYLDSLDADSSTDAYFDKTDWPLFSLATPIQNLAALKILEVQIPFSFYVFNNSNNTFLLTDSTVTNAVVTIPIGNYSTNTMIDQLKISLELVSGNTYTITYSGMGETPSTQKFKIVSSDNTGFSFIFGTAIDTGITNPRLFLGFDAGINASTGNTLNAPNVALVSGPNYLYLNSKFLGPPCTNLLPRGAVNLGAGTAGPQLAKIPINVQPGGVIYWNDENPLMWFPLENLNLISQFDLYITVGNNNRPSVTRLNGLSFSVKLGLLQNKEIVDKIQGQGGGYPGSSLSVPRKRVLF